MPKVRFKDFGQLDFWSEQIYSSMPPDLFLETVAEHIDWVSHVHHLFNLSYLMFKVLPK